MNDLPETVAAMLTDPATPTAPLRDFLKAYQQDDNLWWSIGCGHHQNLFDAAVEQVMDYENRITWDTTCENCARLLDKSIFDYERAERAEARLRAVEALHHVLRNGAGEPVECECGERWPCPTALAAAVPDPQPTDETE